MALDDIESWPEYKHVFNDLAGESLEDSLKLNVSGFDSSVARFTPSAGDFRYFYSAGDIES